MSTANGIDGDKSPERAPATTEPRSTEIVADPQTSGVPNPTTSKVSFSLSLYISTD
jgi:hypothetical protein